MISSDNGLSRWGDRKVEETPADRLIKARIGAGFSSPTDAANEFRWKFPTYYSHENGSRGITKSAATRYGKAYKVSAAWLLLGGDPGDYPMEQLPRLDRDLLLLAFERLLVLFVPGMDQQQALALAEAVLGLVLFHQRHKNKIKARENLSKALDDVAKSIEPEESQ